MTPTEKTGVLLLNLGGPDSLEAVKPFLYNLFSDPDIFPLPAAPLVQKPFATLISTFRAGMTRDMYAQIGGRSPILPLTKAQASALEAFLCEQDFPATVYIGMSYWHPLVENTIDQILRDGITHLIVLPLFPQFSETTTGSCQRAVKRLLAQRGVPLKTTFIADYYDHPAYLKAVSDTIQESLASCTWNCAPEDVLVLFSAHSLPVASIEKTKDVYPHQIDTTVKLIMRTHFPSNPWRIAFQSKIGKIRWLEPYTEAMLHTLSQEKVHNVLMVPISFVSDHIETLYEIDLLYLPLAQKLGIEHCHRVASLNTRPTFIEALAQVVQESVPKPIAGREKVAV